MLSTRALILLSLYVSQAASFGGFDPALIHHSVTTAGSAIDSFLHSSSHHLIASSAPVAPAATGPLSDVSGAASQILKNYRQCLATNPLPTKMMTGAVLATCGDAIAQSKEDAPYDKKRASSFAVFDMAYRALQHASFPWIIQHCKGQFLTASLTAATAAATTTHHATAVSPEITNYFAAIEQTLASQLAIVPFLYYPVFFALTGFIQGLDAEGSVERAKEKFFPLMQRNLLFWLPVQFIQFGFIEESLQIPFLSVCGLCWTFILSVAAGDANANATTNAVEDEGVVMAVSTEQQPIYQNQVGDLGTAMLKSTSTSTSTSEPEVFGLADEKQEEPVPGLVYDKSY